jgi:trk system potassium uptake protein TrkA
MGKYAIFGLGNFGRTLALALSEGGEEVIAVDNKPELVEEIADRVAQAVVLDSTDERALRAQGVGDVDIAVVAIGEDFEANALTTAVLKGIGVTRVITRASVPVQQQILQRIGADEVISPEDESAQRLAKKLLKPNVMEHIQLADGHSMAQVVSPDHFVGRTIMEIDLRKKYGVNLIAIKKTVTAKDGREADRVVNVTDPKYVIEKGDVLFLVGSDASIDLLTQM